MAFPTTGFVIYHNPSCTKSSKSTKLLQDNQEKGNYALKTVIYHETTPSVEELKSLVEYLGMNNKDDPSIERPWNQDRPWDYLLRPEAQGKAPSFEEAFEIIRQNPLMMERPFVVDCDHKCAVLGRPDISRVEKMVADRLAHP